MDSTNKIDRFKNYLGPWWLNLIVGSFLLGIYLLVDILINRLTGGGIQFVKIIVLAIGLVGDLILFLFITKIFYILFSYFKKLDKKLKIIILSCLLIILLLPFIDFGVFNSTIKSYRIYKNINEDSYRAFNFVDTYKVFKDSVVGTNKGLYIITMDPNIISSLYTYKNCDIYDRANWSCKIDNEERYFGFKNGIWASGYDMDMSGDLTNNTIIDGVSKIKYTFYKLENLFN